MLGKIDLIIEIVIYGQDGLLVGHGYYNSGSTALDLKLKLMDHSG